MKFSYVMKKIYLLLVLIFLIPSFSFGQSSERSVDILETSHPNNSIRDSGGKAILTDERAIELVEINTEGKIIKLGETFVAGDEWLRTLTIKMKNVSGKTISRIVIKLMFPETKKGNSYSGSWIEYSAVNANTGETNEKKLIMPNDVAVLTKDHYEEMKQRMKESNLSTINQVIVSAVEVNFTDGSFWQSNRLSQFR